MSSNQIWRPPSTGSSSTQSPGQSPPLPALVDCPGCRVELVRIVSKQPKTYGQSFVKCPNNIKDDPTTCGVIMSEAQYAAYLRNPGELPARWKKSIPPSFGDLGGGCDDRILEMKQELDALKLKVDSAVDELWDLKVQMQRLKSESVVIAAVFLGVALGCIVSKLW